MDSGGTRQRKKGAASGSAAGASPAAAASAKQATKTDASAGKAHEDLSAGPVWDDDSDEEIPAAAAAPVAIAADKFDEAPADDGLVICAGFLGASLCFITGLITPKFGVNAELLMIGAFAALCVAILSVTFCRCGRKEQGAPIENVTPQAVFFFTGCIGLMLGGMVGGTLKNVPLADLVPSF